MGRVFFEQPGLPEAGHDPDAGSGSGGHGEQTGKMLAGIEKILIEDYPFGGGRAGAGIVNILEGHR